MIKKVSSLFLISTLLVGCGGSDGGKKKPNSSSSSVSTSAPASSAPASSTPASSEPASSAPVSSAPASSEPSSSSSSSSGPTVIVADMTKDWRANGEGNSGITYDSIGVAFNASAAGVGAVFDIAAPIQLEGAQLELVVTVSSEYKASGAALQPFAQIKGNGWGGEWDCLVENAEFEAATDITALCTIDTPDNKFNQTELGVQLGIQAFGDAPSGVVTIKSAKVTLPSETSSSSSSEGSTSSSSESTSSSSSSQTGTYTFTSLDGWSVNGGGSPNLLQVELNAATGSGINLVPIDWSQNSASGWKYEARYALPTPVDIVAGTQISFTLSIPQSYITDATAVVQVDWGNAGTYKYGGAGGGYRTLSAAGGVSATTDFVITETVASGDAVQGATIVGLQLAKAPTDKSILDKILIKSITIQ